MIDTRFYIKKCTPTLAEVAALCGAELQDASRAAETVTDINTMDKAGAGDAAVPPVDEGERHHIFKHIDGKKGRQEPLRRRKAQNRSALLLQHGHPPPLALISIFRLI